MCENQKYIFILIQQKSFWKKLYHTADAFCLFFFLQVQQFDARLLHNKFLHDELSKVHEVLRLCVLYGLLDLWRQENTGLPDFNELW